jgi:hypothetical protein
MGVGILASQPVDRRRRGPAPKSSSTKPIEIFSDDPEVKLIQGIIAGMHHVGERHLNLRHFKLLMTVYLIGRAYNGTKPNREMIAAIARLQINDLDPELTELVDKRYLVENIPTFGHVTSKNTTYKLGSMGGTLMRHITGGNSRLVHEVSG